MLLKFESIHIKGRSLAFEVGITWLLSLLGMRPVLLGKYEQIGSANNQISFDIVASYGKDIILLVNVTTGRVDPSHIDVEKNYRDKLLQQVDIPNVKLKSILFSGMSVSELKKTVNNNDVILVGRDELTQVLDLLRKGDTEEARRFLIEERDYFSDGI